MKTTNYINTFIEVSEDCPTSEGEIPVPRGEEKTAALIQYEMVGENPYAYTSDDVLFEVYALKNKVTSKARAREREKFFSKGQACFRSSPLTKRYGWGVHNDEHGKIALYSVGSSEYKKLVKDKTLAHVKGMRSKRAS
jgi:hypothetical protein